ncbi:MAG: hypothetical protein GWN47_03360 [Woeseiaceae bacterium]|nr:hypothetical protein [Woeseiaceae bacterium]
MARNGFKEQVRRNSVALISLVVAVSSLSYNTWRNERTEYNRNQRVISVEVLQKLESLQELVFYLHYDRDTESRGSARSGWAIVLTIRDLSQILEGPQPSSAERLHATWDEHWSWLGKNQTSAEAVLASIEDVRNETRELLRSLD